MKVQLFTFNEVVDALHRLAREEDSISALLMAGDFRTRFETYVSASRATRDEGNLLTLPSRLVAIDHHGTDVYTLDDIQGSITKKQFAKFTKFIKDQGIAISVDETTYIPTHLVDCFIQGEQPEPAPEDDVQEREEETTRLKFA